MKKLMAVCAAALMLASIATSCNKKCECKHYVNGKLDSTDAPFEVENGKKCSDYNQEYTILGITTKIDCKTTF